METDQLTQPITDTPKKSGMAQFALTSGILSLVFYFFIGGGRVFSLAILTLIFSLMAITFGFVSLVKIRETQTKGKASAILGIIFGFIPLFMIVAVTLITQSLPGGVAVLSCEGYRTNYMQSKPTNYGESLLNDAFNRQSVDRCYGEKAIRENNLDLFTKIESQHTADAYYLAYAVYYNKDSSFCDRITDANIKNHCYAVTKKDTSYCEQIDTSKYSFKPDCLKLTAPFVPRD